MGRLSPSSGTSFREAKGHLAQRSTIEKCLVMLAADSNQVGEFDENAVSPRSPTITGLVAPAHIT